MIAVLWINEINKKATMKAMEKGPIFGMNFSKGLSIGEHILFMIWCQEYTFGLGIQLSIADINKAARKNMNMESIRITILKKNTKIIPSKFN